MSRIRANTIALTLSFFATAFFFFLQLKILTNFLDQTAVGVWTAVTALGMILSPLSQLGMPQVLVRYGAKFDAEDRLHRLRPLHGLAVRIFFGGLVAVSAILIVAGPALASVLGEGEFDRRLLVLGFVAVGTGSIRAVNNASLRGLRRMTVMAALEIAFSVLVTLAYFLFRHRLTVELTLVLFGVASSAVAIAGHLYLVRLFRRIPGPETPEKGSVFREVRGFWSGAAMGGIFLVAMEQLDRPILAAGLVTLQQLAVFQVAARLALFPRRLSYVPFQVMYPEITHKWEGPRRGELRGDMELFTKLVLALGIGVSAVLCVFAKPFILLVATPEYLSGAWILWMFMAVFPLVTLHQPLILFLRATGRVWFAFAGEAGWLAAYLGLGTLLLGRFGLPGFVGGQLAGSSLVLAYALVLFHRLELPRPALRFYLTRILIAGLVWGLSVLLGAHLPLLIWWQLALLALAAGAVGNFVLVRSGFLTREEEDRAIALLAGRGTIGRVAGFFFAWPRRGHA